MKKQKLEKLEALRGFAALYVVFFHVLPQSFYLWGINFGILFRFGPESVILFFILSGFVIKYTYEKSRDKTFKTYFIRRFLRLYVPLIAIFLLGYVLKCLDEGTFTNPELLTLGGNLLMLQDVATQKPNVLCGVYLANGPLWSLSYEWWFYMLFFLLVTKIKSVQLNTWVYTLTIIAAVSYLFYPFFINRLVMYFAIWWIGVKFATTYLAGAKFAIRDYLPYTGVLLSMTLILALNLFLKRDLIHTYVYPYSAYPIIEFRHFAFALIVMFSSLMWQKFKWVGFNSLFGIFKYIAPCSYVIYISHHYLVVHATYLKFLNNRGLEVGLYIVIMIAFSYLVEVFLYNKVKTMILG
ncbi:MAG: acyltransferase [Bacteroidota bacterium]